MVLPALRQASLPLFLAFLIVLTIPWPTTATAEELSHATGTDFAPGTFDRTVLTGTEEAPLISLGTTTDFDWFFTDDDIAGWSLQTNAAGNVAEENPDGEIHLSALYDGLDSGSWAYARRSDVTLPTRFSAEFRLRLDDMATSGVVDPLIDQPTGASARLDLLGSGAGLRVDVFTDRLTAFYREGSTGADYPVISYFDLTSNLGQWYTLRFDVDFGDPDLAVQVYRDGLWVGELNADVRNATGSPLLGPLAYSRGSTSGRAEFHVDLVRVGTETEVMAQSGTYTSAALHLDAGALGPLTWQEVSTSPYPWQPWQKYAGNPTIAGPALPENMLVDIEDPLMQPIQYDGKYWWCYSSGGPGMTIRLAYTTDPELLTWTDYEANPVLAAVSGETYVFSPNLFKLGELYYLVYDVQLSSDGHQRLAYATAPAPTGPFTRGQIILELGAPGEWDDLRVTEPFVFKDGDTYFMYYMGDHGCSGCAEQIGLATTTAALFPLGPEPGGLWTKHGLVLPHDPDPSGWDTGLTADPGVIKVGDIFFMRYTGSYGNEHWQLGTAWATNPYGPWHRPAGPDVLRGAEGEWDDDRLVRGALHYHNGKYYGPYSGNGGGGWSGYQGGLVTADPLPAALELVFETRTSPDGSVWEDWQAVGSGGTVESTPDTYFQYRASFAASGGNSPELRQVTLMYASPPAAVGQPPAMALRLLRPYPNPFNPRTVIAFELGRAQDVSLSVYDLTGRQVVRLTAGLFPAGRHEAIWHGVDAAGRAVASGTYFVRLSGDGADAVQRLALIR